MEVMTKNLDSIHFDETENQVMIAEMIKNFGAREIKPFMMEWDESQHFPVELFKKLGTHGLMGVLVPEEYGGSGFGYLEYMTVVSEISKIDGSIGLSVAAHNSLFTNLILLF
jgi:alkylation response protein AidB-like acyl-CoA dehydrogenase